MPLDHDKDDEVDEYRQIRPNMDESSFKKHYKQFPGAGKITGHSEPYFVTLMDKARSTQTGNIYHPFTSLEEWSLARWLHETGVSMSRVDEFLRLPLVCSCFILAYDHF
jgi:hypothetical protein